MLLVGHLVSSAHLPIPMFHTWACASCIIAGSEIFMFNSARPVCWSWDVHFDGMVLVVGVFVVILVGCGSVVVLSTLVINYSLWLYMHIMFMV